MKMSIHAISNSTDNDPEKSSCNGRKGNLEDDPTSGIGVSGNREAASVLWSSPIGIGDSRNSRRSYDIIKDIGTGSFGKAVLVQEKSSGKQYVMKLIETSSLGPKERRDTLNEIRVLSSLRHPYIISYKESFIQENGLLSIVMDYADGGDLYKTIAIQRKTNGKGFPESQIIRWFTQASLALKYLHDKHILHRDLKSQNLFLMSNGRLRLGDFGIAKVLDGTTAFTKTQIGTPYYLSPEICKNQPYSWASDIWSLGCILYQLATLHVPFNAPNISILIEKITRHQTPPFPDSYSLGLRRLYNECMQREWQKRPSATAILFKDIIQDEIKKMLFEEQEKRRQPDGVPFSVFSTPSLSQQSIAASTTTSTDVDTKDNKTTKISSNVKQSPSSPSGQNNNRNFDFLESSWSQECPSVKIKVNNDSGFSTPTLYTKSHGGVQRTGQRSYNQWHRPSDGKSALSHKSGQTPEKRRLMVCENHSYSSPQLQYEQNNKNEKSFKEKSRNAGRLLPIVNDKRSSVGRFLKPPSVTSSRCSNSSSWAESSGNTKGSESNDHAVGNQSLNTAAASTTNGSSFTSNDLAVECSGTSKEHRSSSSLNRENHLNYIKKNKDVWMKNCQKADVINKKPIGLTTKTAAIGNNSIQTILRGQKSGQRGSLYSVTSSNARSNTTQRCQHQYNPDDDSNNQICSDLDSNHKRGEIHQQKSGKNTKASSLQQNLHSQSPRETEPTSFNWIKRFHKKK